MKPFFVAKNTTPLMVCGLALLLLLCSETSFAVSTGGGLPYESWLTKLMDSITGPFAFAVSIIGLVVGFTPLIFGFELGKFSLTLIGLVIVISFVVAAKNAFTAITGIGALISPEFIHVLGIGS